MKRKISYILSALLLMIVLSLSVSAATVTASPYRESIVGYDKAYARMYDAIAAGEESVDLADLKLRDRDVVQLYSDIVGSCPEFFYLDSRITYNYVTQGIRKTVTKVGFIYRMTVEERMDAQEAYERELSAIVSLVDPSMTDVEKALWVHDYLIATCSYDESQTLFDAYSLFTQRSGVCQAYSLGYAAVMRRLGIETVMITSQEMNHAWNLVKLGENWYHVDLVYDDPTTDRMGRVYHENFLLDDESIQHTEPAHSGWVSSLKCTDSGYQDALWTTIRNRMVKIDKQWYFIDPETATLSCSYLDGRYRIDVYTFTEKWDVEGLPGQYWVGLYTGLSEWLGVLFFNTQDSIMMYDPDTGKVERYMKEEEKRIFGSSVYGDILEYMLADSPEDRDVRIRGVPLTESGVEMPLPFVDISRRDPIYPAIQFVYSHGLFKGVSDTRFAPDATLTRAMFVTVLGRLCGIDTAEYPGLSYTDVEEGQWYTPYVEWASQSGIVNGMGDGLFAPMGEITHEQMCKIVAQCGVYLQLGNNAEPEIVLPYRDREDISEWAAAGVGYCVKNGLLRTDGFFLPQEKATRGEAAQLISNFAVLCGIQ